MTTIYVVAGEWADTEWREVAAKPVSQWTEAEADLYRQGPRAHPWSGINAYCVEQPDGRVFVFPSQAHADAFAGKAEAPVEPSAPTVPDHPSEAE